MVDGFLIRSVLISLISDTSPIGGHRY